MKGQHATLKPLYPESLGTLILPPALIRLNRIIAVVFLSVNIPSREHCQEKQYQFALPKPLDWEVEWVIESITNRRMFFGRGISNDG